MATSAQPRSSGGGASSLEAGLERLIEPCLYLVASVLALATVAPLLVVAAPVWLALAGLRTRSWWVKGPAVALCFLPALVALLVAYLAHGSDPIDVVVGYINVQIDAGIALAEAWRSGAPFPWWGYTSQVWPYALTGGPLVGAVGHVVSCSLGYGRTARHDLRTVSADELGKLESKPESQPVAGLLARGRLTAITALPKQGKTFAWFGLLKARQTGGEWFGRRVESGKTLVMTEEDRGTFAGKVKRFRINGKALESVHAPETDDARFGQEAWAELVGDAARLAHKKGCDTLCLDTLTTWAPWAFRGPEHMSYALRTLKQAVGKHQLAGCVILHNRKQQSDLGAVVDMLGTIAGSAAYDVIAGFKREKESGECTLAVDGRLGEWECTAVLKDGRYVPIGGGPEPAPVSATTDTLSAVPVPAHLRGTLARLREAPGATTGDALLAQEGGSKRALLNRLEALAALGLASRSGRGVAGDPYAWEASGAPSVAAPAPATDDPHYVAYLNSPAWHVKRREILERAGGICEGCGEGAPAEVHHLTYERLGDELPEDLAALCAPCHRRAHAAA